MNMKLETNLLKSKKKNEHNKFGREILKNIFKREELEYSEKAIEEVLSEFNLTLTYCAQILKIDPNHSQAIILSIKTRKITCDWTYYEKDCFFNYGGNAPLRGMHQ